MSDKQHKTTVEPTDNTMTEETEIVEGEIARTAIIKWEPENFDLIYGLNVNPAMPEEEFQSLLFSVAPYTKVKTDKLMNHLGERLTIAGAATHDAEVTAPAGMVNVHTGEALETIVRPRTIFKVVAIGGERLKKPLKVSCVAVSIFNEMKRLYYKRYGFLDWRVEIDMIFNQQPAKVGNVYVITPVRPEKA